MVLLHGNAAVESGFWINKDLLIDKILEEAVVTRHVIFDSIWNAGMDIKNAELPYRR